MCVNCSVLPKTHSMAQCSVRTPLKHNNDLIYEQQQPYSS